MAVVVTVAAFFLTLWLNTGTLATKFENVLLFITYWVPPFAAIQMVDWWRRRGKMNVREVLSATLMPTPKQHVRRRCSARRHPSDRPARE